MCIRISWLFASAADLKRKLKQPMCGQDLCSSSIDLLEGESCVSSEFMASGEVYIQPMKELAADSLFLNRLSFVMGEFLTRQSPTIKHREWKTAISTELYPKVTTSVDETCPALRQYNSNHKP